MNRLFRFSYAGIVAGTLAWVPLVRGQVPDPCAESSCRALTLEERGAFGRVLAKLIAAVPTPDDGRFQQAGLKSMQGIASTLVTEATWQSPVFPSNVVDPMAMSHSGRAFPRTLGLVYSYVLKDERERARLGLGDAFHTTGDGEMEAFDLQIRLSASARPALASREALGEGKKMERSKDVLLWDARLPPEEKGTKRIVMLLGARIERAEEPGAVAGETAPGQLAPVRSIRIELHGPKADVEALKKRIDRKALLKLLRSEGGKSGAPH